MERQVLERVKVLEAEGYCSEAAEGSLEIMARRMLPGYVAPFGIVNVTVISRRRRGPEVSVEAIVRLKVGDEEIHTVAEGVGPVHALDRAFHKGLDAHYPELKQVQLCDYRVRILDPETAASANTRVLVESTRGGERWSTSGVSPNIIEASCLALADAFELPLARALMREFSAAQPA
jgi:2-isopropylmalate synthase